MSTHHHQTDQQRDHRVGFYSDRDYQHHHHHHHHHHIHRHIYHHHHIDRIAQGGYGGGFYSDRDYAADYSNRRVPPPR